MAFVSQPVLPVRSGTTTATSVTRPASSLRGGSHFVTAPNFGAPAAARLHAAPAHAPAPVHMSVVVEQPNVAVVTGASSSIGLYATKNLTDRGDYHVVMAVRDADKAKRSAEAVGLRPGTYTIVPLDLAKLQNVRDFVKALQSLGFSKINALVCNAATWYPRDKSARLTPDGYDETVQVNHLSQFLLVNLLLPSVQKAKGRVVFLATQTHNPDTLPGKIPPQADLGALAGLKAGFQSSPGTIDGKTFEPTKAYKDSKVCNILTMQELSRRFGSSGVTFSAIFPGCIAESGLFREKRGWFRWFFPLFQKYITKQYVSVEEAGRRVALVASDGQFGDNGMYWQWRGSFLDGIDKTSPVPIDPTEREADKAEELWDLSAKLVGLSA